MIGLPASSAWARAALACSIFLLVVDPFRITTSMGIWEYIGTCRTQTSIMADLGQTTRVRLWPRLVIRSTATLVLPDPISMNSPTAGKFLANWNARFWWTQEGVPLGWSGSSSSLICLTAAASMMALAIAKTSG